MAKAGMAVVAYGVNDTLIAGNVIEEYITIKSGEGVCARGHLIAYNTSGEWVKYVSGGSAGAEIVRGIVSEADGVDATSAAVKALAIVSGEVLGTGLVGINYIASTMDTPVAPTLLLQAGGTLAATTAHKYKVTAVDVEGGITAPSTVATETTTAVSAGYVTGAVVANIAAVNTILGDCSVTPKAVIFTVDGVTYSKTFNLDYTGAGALANHAALITALDTAASTVTSSDGAAIRITSDTTGAASIVTIVSDGTGLFTTPTTVVGLAVRRTIKVTVPEVEGAVAYKVWRSVDGGSTYLYRLMLAAEITNGYFTDDGSLTFTAGTPVTATDYTAIGQMWDRKIFISEMLNGYDFREGY
jgi:hypothetical protein